MPAFAIGRVVLGLLVAPLLAAPVLPLLWCAVDSGPVLACAATSGGAVLLLLWLVVLCGYPAVFVVGGPLFFIMRRRGSLRPLPIALAGAGIALVASGLFILVEEKWSAEAVVHWIPFSLRAGVPVAGALAGLVFWAIGVFRNRALAVRREAA